MTSVGHKDNPDRMKPDKFRSYKTMGELCAIVKRDRRRIVQLEQAGRIPAPIRVKVGRLKVRLYSPGEVTKIVQYFKTSRPGGRTKEELHGKNIRA